MIIRRQSGRPRERAGPQWGQIWIFDIWARAPASRPVPGPASSVASSPHDRVIVKVTDLTPLPQHGARKGPCRFGRMPPSSLQPHPRELIPAGPTWVHYEVVGVPEHSMDRMMPEARTSPAATPSFPLRNQSDPRLPTQWRRRIRDARGRCFHLPWGPWLIIPKSSY